MSVWTVSGYWCWSACLCECCCLNTVHPAVCVSVCISSADITISPSACLCICLCVSLCVCVSVCINCRHHPLTVCVCVCVCSYPALLPLPCHVSDMSAAKVARCHRHSRLPVATWKHPRTRALLLRGAAFYKSVRGMIMAHQGTSRCFFLFSPNLLNGRIGEDRAHGRIMTPTVDAP